MFLQADFPSEKPKNCIRTLIFFSLFFPIFRETCLVVFPCENHTFLSIKRYPFICDEGAVLPLAQ